jgi:ferredoxin-NADP reductase
MSYKLKLIEKNNVADGTMSFKIDITNVDFKFIAGQFVSVMIKDMHYHDEKGNVRTFSIASSPLHKDYFMFATRMRESAFKKTLKEIPVGTLIDIFGPTGKFNLPDETLKPVVLLAGGIGITPFRGMIEYATNVKLPTEIYLFYSNKTLLVTAFLKDLQKWSRENSKFHLIPTFSEENVSGFENGRINEIMIKKHVPNYTNANYYIAGPIAMVTALRDVVSGIGISNENIKYEEFTGY